MQPQSILKHEHHFCEHTSTLVGRGISLPGATT